MKCRLCDSKTRLIFSEVAGAPDNKVYFCPSCELGFLKHFFDANHYKTDDYKKRFRQNTVKEWHDGELNNQKKRINIVTEYLKFLHQCLEIGAGNGAFAKIASRHIDIYHVIDFSEECCQFIRQMNIVTDDRPYQHSQFKDVEYDGVFAFHVLEHTDDPVQFLKQLNTKYVFLEVPNLGDQLLTYSHEFRKLWFQAPHNWYFSDVGVAQIARRAGYTVVATHYIQNYPILNSLWWYLNNKKYPYNKENHLPYPDNPVVDKINELLDIINPAFCEFLSVTRQTGELFMVLKKEGV